MKKLLFVLIVVIAVNGALFAGGSKDAGNKKGASQNKIICGITEFEPMNFRDANGNWTGFDTELAILVGQKLNLPVEFQEIEWANKYQELEAGTITCIWNGFTANSSEEDGTPRAAIVDFSLSYLLNQQSIVVRASRAGEFRTVESLLGKTAAVETGSAGESAAKEIVGDRGKLIGSPAQINTFLEVKSGAVDFAVIDILLAQRIAGTGDYSDLTVANISLDSEVYAIGFKKGSSLKDKVNGVLEELYKNGTMLRLAQKYKLSDSLILKPL